MFLGVLALFSLRFKYQFSCFALLAGGIWNALWYGLRHIGDFWGYASIVTGVLMVLAAIHLLGIVKLPSVLSKLLALGLAAGFLLYTVTIVQLNLGYATL